MGVIANSGIIISCVNILASRDCLLTRNGCVICQFNDISVSKYPRENYVVETRQNPGWQICNGCHQTQTLGSRNKTYAGTANRKQKDTKEDLKMPGYEGSLLAGYLYPSLIHSHQAGHLADPALNHAHQEETSQFLLIPASLLIAFGKSCSSTDLEGAATIQH